MSAEMDNNRPSNLPTQPPETKEGQRIENVDLDAFERLVFNRQHEEAAKMLIWMLERIRVGGEFIGYTIDDAAKPALCTRLASAIVALFCDRAFNFNEMGFDKLSIEHSTISAIFQSSIYETSDFVIRHFMEDPTVVAAGEVRFLNPSAAIKFLLLYSLNSVNDVDLHKVFSQGDGYMLPLWLGMMASLMALNRRSFDRRETLHQLTGLFENGKIRDELLVVLSDSYMYTSYATLRQKHETKRLLNRLLVKLAEERKVQIPKLRTIRDRKNKRPTIVVPCDWWTNVHAMYRCYAPTIEQLKTRFRVIGAGRAQDSNEEGRALFDKWLMLPPDHLILQDIVTMLRREQPDIIYYPSIGMSPWWMAISNLRLAPIQIMSMGHPASSQSTEIDYVLVEKGLVGDPSLFTERILEIPSDGIRYLIRQDAEWPTNHEARENVNTIRFVIPAMVCKISAPFLETLKQIQDKCAERSVKTEFHFFPNLLGVMRYAFLKEVSKFLTTPVVATRLYYTEYLKRINACHISLSPFPFGGTNSNIDAMMLGLPIVTLEGLDVHERIDASMLRRMKTHSTIAKTVEEYVKISVRLAETWQSRAQATFTFEKELIEEEFFGPGPLHVREAIVRAFRYVYEHHEEIVEVGGRVIDGPRPELSELRN